MKGRPTRNQGVKQKAEDMPVTICVLQGETNIYIEREKKVKVSEKEKRKGWGTFPLKEQESKAQFPVKSLVITSTCG